MEFKLFFAVVEKLEPAILFKLVSTSYMRKLAYQLLHSQKLENYDI
jgi:hypothetical protein